MARKYRCRYWPRAGKSRLSSVSANSSKYESSIGKRGGAGAPGLGISGIDLTSAYPRGVWGKRLKLSIFLCSNQESIGTGPGKPACESYLPKCRRILLQKKGIMVRESERPRRRLSGV